LAPSKGAGFQAALLEAFARAAGAKVVAAELFVEPLVAVDDAETPFDMRFGGESPSPFVHRLEKKGKSSNSCALMGHLAFSEQGHREDTRVDWRFGRAEARVVRLLEN
jgi:hypothetical protein